MDMKLPIGIQDFQKLREEGFAYVDKTKYAYWLAHGNVPCFLSRPRRFGKSLFLSTMKAYFEGKKHLFSGLAIEQFEEGNAKAWEPSPVFYIDFDGSNYNSDAIEKVIDSILKDWEKIYGDEYKERIFGNRFQKLMEKAYEQTGRRCVVLIDEYDKPLLDTIDKPEIHAHIKEVLKGFFGALKKADASISFIMITGVSKFHKVSLFSDLNQLRDISLTKQYAGICGITEEEKSRYFMDQVEDLANEQGMTKEECLLELKKMYDGYRFHPSGECVYSPQSILNAFANLEFGSYWFESGTPTFLLKKTKETHFDVRRFTNQTIFASQALLKDYTGDTLDLVPIMYQTGYLTIVGYERTEQKYILSFPNEEVKYGFLEGLLPCYIPAATSSNGLDIFSFLNDVKMGSLDKIRDKLIALFARIAYTNKDDPFEHYFQSVIYVLFTLLGQFVACEMHTFNGRIDCLVETQSHVYLFEFKRDDTADAALKQIDEYTLPFVADARKLYKIGVSFDSATRQLNGWKVA